MSKVDVGKLVGESVRAESDYGKATAWMRKKQVFTKTDVIDFLMSIGKVERAAYETAIVLLSPRKTSARGDCRGNASNPWGHLAYVEKLARSVVGGVKEDQKFRFRLRNILLDPRRRVQPEAKSVKVVKDAVKVTAPAKAVESIS